MAAVRRGAAAGREGHALPEVPARPALETRPCCTAAERPPPRRCRRRRCCHVHSTAGAHGAGARMVALRRDSARTAPSQLFSGGSAPVGSTCSASIPPSPLLCPGRAAASLFRKSRLLARLNACARAPMPAFERAM